MRLACILVAVLACGACVGQTGGQTVSFPVSAAGPADATAGQPLSFTSSGFDVVLSSATLHVGAVYLDESRAVSGAQATACQLSGTYVAQETSPLTVDLLNPAPQPFPARALAITDPPPLIGEVWLTGGDVNASNDPTPILVFAGTATRGGQAFPFTGTVTIGANRQAASTSGAAGTPICKARIVTQVPAALTLRSAGGLLLRVDPRSFFGGVDFGALPAPPGGNGAIFPDDSSNAQSQKLFVNLHSYGAYAFSWSGAP